MVWIVVVIKQLEARTQTRRKPLYSSWGEIFFSIEYHVIPAGL